MTVDPYIPVPPVHYGGIERVVDLLVRQLVSRGHQLTVLAHPDSRVEATLAPYGCPPHVGLAARTKELGAAIAAVWTRRHEVDVVHSFGRLAALLPVLPLRSLPKIQSYQREIPWRSVGRAAALAGDSIAFTACARGAYVERPDGKVGRWITIPNAVDTSKYELRAAVEADAPLVFLGRIERIKGAHHAIAIAGIAKRRLIIAGNVAAAHEQYFNDEIAPHLDGRDVVFAGEVDDARKNELLGVAAAMLMPIEWEEPFGIVMIEAMACGTPVIAFRRGSVPDVVRDGVNGFVCDSVDDAARAVARLAAIDRRVVRDDCVARFDGSVIASAYEGLYEEMRRRSSAWAKS